MSAAPAHVAPIAAAPEPDVCDQPSIVAQLCWHTSVVCHALDRGVAELQAALAVATEHVDAIVALAIRMPYHPSDRQPPTSDVLEVPS